MVWPQHGNYTEFQNWTGDAFNYYRLNDPVRYVSVAPAPAVWDPISENGTLWDVTFMAGGAARKVRMTMAPPIGHTKITDPWIEWTPTIIWERRLKSKLAGGMQPVIGTNPSFREYTFAYRAAGKDLICQWRDIQDWDNPDQGDYTTQMIAEVGAPPEMDTHIGEQPVVAYIRNGAFDGTDEFWISCVGTKGGTDAVYLLSWNNAYKNYEMVLSAMEKTWWRVTWDFVASLPTVAANFVIYSNPGIPTYLGWQKWKESMKKYYANKATVAYSSAGAQQRTAATKTAGTATSRRGTTTSTGYTPTSNAASYSRPTTP